jgi:hypothetical protein
MNLNGNVQKAVLQVSVEGGQNQRKATIQNRL